NDRIIRMAEGRLEFVARSPASGAPASKQAREDPMVLERGVNLINLRGTMTADGQVPRVEVRGWDPVHKREVTATEPATTASAQPDSGLSPSTLAGKFNATPYVLGRVDIRAQHQAKAVAAALADHIAGGFSELDGTARGNPKLRAGAAVSLTGVGQAFTGKYVLTATRHEFSREFGYRTHFTASNASERSLFGTASPTTHPRAQVAGVVPALVTNVRDPDNHGRVKIKLPWLADSYESWWARTVQPGAGKDRGSLVLPEIGDEVLVAFGQGDLGDPYILGGLYNGVDPPQGGWAANIDSTDGKIVRRGFVGRTGMRVELLEKAGQESLQISTNAGAQRITLNQTAKGIEILSEGPCTVKAKQNVEVSTGAGNITLKGVNVTVEAKGSLELKGTNVKVTAQAAAELGSSGITSVKGSMVKIN
ncbi:VgrG-related protein, partial [Nocardioides albidus]|uniref:VgrG-related protein n=1 Tax=Nocardioides albidus TaxID=1517589 RepID=UPI00195FD8B6